MRERVEALSAETSVRWLGIASGPWATEAGLVEYRKRHGVHLPLVLDESGALFRAFDVMQVPTALLIAPGGRLARRLELKDLETQSTLACRRGRGIAVAPTSRPGQ